MSGPFCVFAQAYPPASPVYPPMGDAPRAYAPPNPTDPSPVFTLTLDDALARASAGSFSLSAAGSEVEAADGAVIQAGVRPNPELATFVEDTRRESRSTTAQFNIPVELGGKRAARMSASELGRDVARAQLNAARSHLRADVIGAFFEVLIAQERVKLNRASVSLAAQGVLIAGRRVEAGKISPVEELRARVEQANAELAVAEAAAALESAKYGLTALWGATPIVFAQVQGDLDTLPQRPALELLLQELAGAPDLLASRLEWDRRRAMIEVERSKRYPDVTFTAGAKRNNELGVTQAIVGIAIPLPVFDRNQGNLYEAFKRADKAEYDYQAGLVRLGANLRRAANDLAVSRTSAQTLRAAILPAAEQAFDAASRGFEAGKFNFLEVLDAQRTLFQARLRYLDLLAKTYQAAANIDRILGR